MHYTLIDNENVDADSTIDITRNHLNDIILDADVEVDSSDPNLLLFLELLEDPNYKFWFNIVQP